MLVCLHCLLGSGDMDSLPKVQNISLLPSSQQFLFRNPSPSISLLQKKKKKLVVCVTHLLEQNSPGNLSMSNQPGTPREDGEMGGNFLNPFQNESVSL